MSTRKKPSKSLNCRYIYVNSVGERVVVPGKTKLSALLKEAGMFEVNIVNPQEPLILKADYRQHQPQAVTVLYFRP